MPLVHVRGGGRCPCKTAVRAGPTSGSVLRSCREDVDDRRADIDWLCLRRFRSNSESVAGSLRRASRRADSVAGQCAVIETSRLVQQTFAHAPLYQGGCYAIPARGCFRRTPHMHRCIYGAPSWPYPPFYSRPSQNCPSVCSHPLPSPPNSRLPAYCLYLSIYRLLLESVYDRAWRMGGRCVCGMPGRMRLRRTTLFFPTFLGPPLMGVILLCTCRLMCGSVSPVVFNKSCECEEFARKRRPCDARVGLLKPKWPTQRWCRRALDGLRGACFMLQPRRRPQSYCRR